VFLAGLYLEDGRHDAVAEIVQELRELPNLGALTVPALAFHLACRRDGAAAAEPLLDEVFTAIADQSWRSGSQAHDLITGAIHAGLPIERVDRMGRELIDDDIWDDYRTIIAAQIAEAHGDHAAALSGYQAVCESTILTPPIRGSAAVGAARCLLALDRETEAAEEAKVAARLLARWGGWRTAELDRVRDRLGLTPAPDARTVTGAAALTPREREVALLIADGLTNAELARRLYISPKTAAVHVSNILHKLGVTSRTQVAAAVAKPR
jgi:DNA-binding NarL/FixJ family response regulator